MDVFCVLTPEHSLVVTEVYHQMQEINLIFAMQAVPRLHSPGGKSWAGNRVGDLVGTFCLFHSVESTHSDATVT